MKNLESLNGSIFANFAENEVSNIAAIVGGAEGNTSNGFDYRDKCTKRRCDPATDNCSDNPGLADGGGDFGSEADVLGD